MLRSVLSVSCQENISRTSAATYALLYLVQYLQHRGVLYAVVYHWNTIRINEQRTFCIMSRWTLSYSSVYRYIQWHAAVGIEYHGIPGIQSNKTLLLELTSLTWTESISIYCLLQLYATPCNHGALTRIYNQILLTHSASITIKSFHFPLPIPRVPLTSISTDQRRCGEV